MKIIVIEKGGDDVHHSGGTGVGHFDEPIKSLDEHPKIAPHRPRSIYGETYLAKLDTSGLFAWVRPVTGGGYQTSDPVFLLVEDEEK